MKPAYPLLLALFLTTSSYALAQTKMVSHRSHSGSVVTFDVRGEGNFGEYRHHEPFEPANILRKVIRISDSSAIEVHDRGRDTTFNHPLWNNPRIRVDSLRKLMPEISFEGFPESGVTAQARRTEKTDVVAFAPSGARSGDSHGILALSLLSSASALLVAGGIRSNRRKGRRS